MKGKVGMFPLELLSQTIPAYSVAGRFGLDVLGLLWRVRDGADDAGFRLCAYSDLSRLSGIDELFEQGAPSRVERGALRDQVLVVRPRGEFFSNDELALTQVRRQEDRLSIDLTITHVENPNGEPAPRDLYVVLAVDTGKRPPHSLELLFNGRWRDSQGNETPLAGPVAPPQTIEFSD
jgi:hypothetical protein